MRRIYEKINIKDLLDNIESMFNPYELTELSLIMELEYN